MNEVESVVVSVRDVVEVERAEEWFGVVCGAFDACGGDWGVLKELLASGAGDRSFGGEVVEAFVRFVEDRVSDPVVVAGEMRALRDELPRLYGELVARTDHEAAGEAPGADEVEEWDAATAAQWYAHLTTSNNWVGWAGGGEAEWAEFTEWFLYFAEQQQVRRQASSLVERVRNDPAGITAAFANLGVQTAEPAAVPEAAAGWGERAAIRYVELTSGKGWAGWTGDDGDWDPFTQWFLHYAGEDGDHENAQVFIDSVASSPDKIKAFADHGITISTPRAEEPEQPKPAAAAYSPVSVEQLEQLGITEADLDAAARQVDAMLADLGEAD